MRLFLGFSYIVHRSFSLEIIYSRRSIHTIQISRFHEAVLEHLPSPLFDQLAKNNFAKPCQIWTKQMIIEKLVLAACEF